MVGKHKARGRIQASQHRGDPRAGVLADQIRLVQQYHVGEFDLVDEQIGDGAKVAVARGKVARRQLLAARELTQKSRGIDHRHHRVEFRDAAQAESVFEFPAEARGDRHGFGDARRLDQQVIETALRR